LAFFPLGLLLLLLLLLLVVDVVASCLRLPLKLKLRDVKVFETKRTSTQAATINTIATDLLCEDIIFFTCNTQIKRAFYPNFLFFLIT